MSDEIEFSPESFPGSNGDQTVFTLLEVLPNAPRPVGDWAFPQVEKVVAIIEEGIAAYSMRKMLMTHVGFVEHKGGLVAVFLTQWRNTTGDDALRSSRSQMTMFLRGMIRTASLERLVKPVFEPLEETGRDL